MTNATDLTFDKEIAVPGKVLVDFWAAWCGPCRAQAPVLEKLDPLKVKVIKLNVDENPLMTQKYGIMSIPTLILFENGRQKAKTMGLHSLPQLEEFISQ
jgi:thioredoxin 1